jgi:hypothetical protein
MNVGGIGQNIETANEVNLRVGLNFETAGERMRNAGGIRRLRILAEES